jgi:hypothetical protein
MQKPKVKLEDIIKVGTKTAIVSNIYNDSPEIIEVVYLADNKKAYNEDVKWEKDRWNFVDDGPSAGYADKYDRTKPFVEQLHSYLQLKSKGIID